MNTLTKELGNFIKKTENWCVCKLSSSEEHKISDDGEKCKKNVIRKVIRVLRKKKRRKQGTMLEPEVTTFVSTEIEPNPEQMMDSLFGNDNFETMSIIVAKQFFVPTTKPEQIPITVAAAPKDRLSFLKPWMKNVFDFNHNLPEKPSVSDTNLSKIPVKPTLSKTNNNNFVVYEHNIKTGTEKYNRFKTDLEKIYQELSSSKINNNSLSFPEFNVDIKESIETAKSKDECEECESNDVENIDSQTYRFEDSLKNLEIALSNAKRSKRIKVAVPKPFTKLELQRNYNKLDDDIFKNTTKEAFDPSKLENDERTYSSCDIFRNFQYVQKENKQSEDKKKHKRLMSETFNLIQQKGYLPKFTC